MLSFSTNLHHFASCFKIKLFVFSFWLLEIIIFYLIISSFYRARFMPTLLIPHQHWVSEIWKKILLSKTPKKIAKLSGFPTPNFAMFKKNALQPSNYIALQGVGWLSSFPTPLFWTFKKIAFYSSNHLALQNSGSCQLFRHPNYSVFSGTNLSLISRRDYLDSITTEVRLIQANLLASLTCKIHKTSGKLLT